MSLISSRHCLSLVSSIILLSATPYVLVECGCPWWNIWKMKYVTVEEGVMCGSIMTSTFGGREFFAFRTIPFAEPPVGKLRFKAPVPITKWEGTLDATDDGPICIQTLSITEKTVGVEDCLYLNVYTPKIPDNSTNQLLDVMVWIYPGAFYFGGGVSRFYPPDFIMTKDIVLVTFNHRLGAFGFFSTGDDNAPGNYALKDQRLVLKWVQRNIAAFGGNPNSVTLFGCSSGATSVHLHMLSPSSAGLFHKGISMDGTAISPYYQLHNITEHAVKQAKVVDCPVNNITETVECLREVDAKNLSESITNLFAWWIAPSPGYGPVVEYKSEKNPDPFITEDPLDSLRKGNIQKIPWMMGSPSKPGLIFSATAVNVNLLRDQINMYWREILPKILLLDMYVPQEEVPKLLDKLLQFYVGENVYFNSTNLQNCTELLSDVFSLFPNYKSLQLHLHAGHTSIFQYNMAFRGLFSTSIITSLKNYGVSHGDTVLYLFPFKNKPPGSPIIEARDMFLTLWTNFAKYGNPTPPEKTGNVLVDKLKWPTISDVAGDVKLEDMHFRYLNIGQVVLSPDLKGFLNLGLGPVKLHMARDLNKKRMDFLSSLPIYQNCLTNCEGFLDSKKVSPTAAPQTTMS